jgi:hypothetical protein
MASRKFRRSQGDIAFDDDIILDVAEELGFTTQQISHVFAAIFKDIRKIIKNPEVHGFYLPHLGYMNFKSEYARKELERFDNQKKLYPVSSLKRERMNTLRTQVENFDKFYKEKVSPDMSVKCPHKYKSIIQCSYIRHNHTLEELEELHNSR